MQHGEIWRISASPSCQQADQLVIVLKFGKRQRADADAFLAVPLIAATASADRTLIIHKRHGLDQDYLLCVAQLTAIHAEQGLQGPLATIDAGEIAQIEYQLWDVLGAFS